MRVSEVFLSACIIVVSFFGGVKYSLHKLNEETSYWAKQYKETDDKVSAYVKVSDPKTVRLYIKQLNDLLDNMTRLGRIIENGEEIDLTLARIEKEYMILGEQVKLKVTQIDKTLIAMKEEQLRVDEDLNDLFDADMAEMGDVDKLTLVDNKIMNKIKVIQTDLDTIQSLIKDIQDSKIGKKIFK